MPEPKGTPDVFVCPSVPEDVEYLGSRLRQADIDEITANGGLTPHEALEAGLANSTICQSAHYKGEPFLMFGAAPVLDNVGLVWMLGSDVISKAWLPVLRRSRDCLQELHDEFDLLFNYVDARNTVHIKWLRWLGFSFINLHPEFGVGRLPFYEFVRIN